MRRRRTTRSSTGRAAVAYFAVATSSILSCSLMVDTSGFDGERTQTEPVDLDPPPEPPEPRGDAESGAERSEAGADALSDAASESAAPVRSYRDEVLADNPLAYWRLGESEATPAADEVGTSPGVYLGIITFGTAGAIVGDTNTAVLLDGNGAHVNIGDRFAFTQTPSFSLEAWVKPEFLDDNFRRIFSREMEKGGVRSGYFVAASMDDTSFSVYQSTDIGGPPLAIGVYSHVVATSNGSSLRLYINGELVAEEAAPITVQATESELRLGRKSSSSSNSFSGAIDEVAVYGHALSASRVLAHYQAGLGL